MKRYFVLLFIIVAIPFKIWAQIGEHSQLHNMIRAGIVKYIEWRDSFLLETGFYTGKEFYVLTKGIPTDFFTDSCCVIKNVTYVSLDNPDGAPHQFKKMLKKGFRAFFVEYKLYKDRILIDISERSVQKFKGDIMTWFIGYGKFFYEYSRDENDWILKDVKFRGI